jgi:prepilin-type N-terminal cleavage/methylation domain-containing protein
LARFPGPNCPELRTSKGFSLLEVLVAFTVFALVTAVAMQIFSAGVNGAGVAEHYAKATQYAESKLAATGVEEALKEGVREGAFDDDFRWRVEVRRYEDPVPRDQQSIEFERTGFLQLYEIVATVSFTTDDRQVRSVVLRTLQLGPKAAA